jgi:hypothetical protein
MKIPQRMSSLRLSRHSYSHFTEILACGVVYTNKSNDGFPS